MTDNPNASRDNLVAAWLEAKEKATTAVERERGLREQVCTMLFPNPVEGTNTYDLGMGYKVKMTHGYTYDLCKEVGKRITHEEYVSRVETVLSEIEDLGNGADSLASKLVKWKPELSVTEYKKLNVQFPTEAAIKKILDAVIVTKPSSPQVSFEEPK